SSRRCGAEARVDARSRGGRGHPARIWAAGNRGQTDPLPQQIRQQIDAHIPFALYLAQAATGHSQRVRATVRADCMPAPSKLAYLRAAHETLRADVIRGDEEMAAPAQFFQPLGNVCIRADSAVVKSDHPCSQATRGTQVGGDYFGYDGRTFADARDGLHVLIEDLGLQLVQRGVGPVKTA